MTAPVLIEEEKKRMEPTKARDCDFEVDYTLEEVMVVGDYIEQLEKIDKSWRRGKKNVSKQSEVITNTQRLLKTMENQLLHSYKIPLSEATRKAFEAVQTQGAIDEFYLNTLPALAHSLLYDMLNNYCACKKIDG